MSRSHCQDAATPALPGWRIHGAALLALGVVAAAGPAAAGDAAAGKEKAEMCQSCHGLDGITSLPDAPHIAGDSEIYIVSQLNAFRSGAREHEQMSVIASSLSDEDIADLAAWYSSIEVEAKMPE